MTGDRQHEDDGPRVIVGVHGSLGSLQALRYAVSEARRRDAEVWSVLAWTPPGGEGAHARAPCPRLLRELKQECVKRLATAWDQALGGVPPDIAAVLFVVRAPAGRVLVEIADRADDLLVVGAGRRHRIARAFSSSTVRFCVTHARCATVTVPRSAWHEEIEGSVLRRVLPWRASDLSR